MKSFLLRSAVFLLVTAGLYAAIVCTFRVREGDLAVVIDRQNGAVIEAHSAVLSGLWTLSGPTD
jgi:hypothetical protein